MKTDKNKSIIFKYIIDYWGNIPENKLHIESTLSDLGFFGDDKLDFMNSFFAHFEIDYSTFKTKNYIEEEGGFLITTLKGIFQKSSESDFLKEISIHDLILAMERKKWIDS